jgi:hypothetical protein
MSEVDHEQQSSWRSWFRSTGAPPAWGLVRYIVCGLFAGAGSAFPSLRSGERSWGRWQAWSSPPPARANPPGYHGAWQLFRPRWLCS